MQQDLHAHPLNAKIFSYSLNTQLVQNAHAAGNGTQSLMQTVYADVVAEFCNFLKNKKLGFFV
jgi:hypothetical protein